MGGGKKRRVQRVIFQVIGRKRIPFGREWSVQLGQRQPLIQVSGDQTEPLRRLFGRHGSDSSGLSQGEPLNCTSTGWKTSGIAGDERGIDWQRDLGCCGGEVDLFCMDYEGIEDEDEDEDEELEEIVRLSEVSFDFISFSLFYFSFIFYVSNFILLFFYPLRCIGVH